VSHPQKGNARMHDLEEFSLVQFYDSNLGCHVSELN